MENFGELWGGMEHLGLFVRVKSFAGFWSDLEGLGECQRVTTHLGEFESTWESLR